MFLNKFQFRQMTNVYEHLENFVHILLSESSSENYTTDQQMQFLPDFQIDIISHTC